MVISWVRSPWARSVTLSDNIMAFLKNLEERYNQTVDELYSPKFHPAKDSGELHPIITVLPNDPNRNQGPGGMSRLVPIDRVLVDQNRMTKFLTSPMGLQFILREQLLQTGNAISETRIINPLFVNLNLTPNAHFNRQLLDQTDQQFDSAERSPASTPLIGIAGRLQVETAALATVKITNTPSGRSALANLASSQIGQTILGAAGALGIGSVGGTLGVNERPELDVNGKFYSVLLREGFEPFAQQQLSTLMDALNSAGTAGSIIGIPNVFRGIGLGGGANPIPSQTQQMRYFITDDENAIRYLNDYTALSRRPLLFTPSSQRIDAAGLGTVPRGQTAEELFGVSKNEIVRVTLPTNELVSETNEPQNQQTSVVDQMSIPEDALESRYASDERLDFVKNALAEQAKLIQKFTQPSGNQPETPNRGIVGGITLQELQKLSDGSTVISDNLAAQEYFQALPRREIGINDARRAVGYYHDTLNLVGRITGSVGLPTNDPTFPQDFINVTILDKVNDRLEPFRAIIESIGEEIAPEYNEVRYIGRVERNIVYLGARRTANFVLFLNAWSPRELQAIWDKINFISGLAFPSKVSSDGFLLPPIVELTIGDVYKNQPGYFSQISHTFHDETSTWEIEPGSQVPKWVRMELVFEVIEKDSVTSASPFYGFGVPLT